jgi:SpoVK/Ycf46/Vps4 family AAA+-type ATPase
LLGNYTPRRTKSRYQPDSCTNGVILSKDIKEKTLFFNAVDQQQIDRLASLLSQDNLSSVQKRLEESGMRKGFACLFYGAPGTGKTETVLQLARQTGRDIFQVDIASIRDKYVGESEKNIKRAFSFYREMCKHKSIMPILFFNEADALINNRMEKTEHSVDKMNNAMQNIILQEIESLEGILIATTNLTSTLDKAFERRFLYKVEFHKPDTDVKTKIWRSMLPNLSSDEARHLAVRYDFSGGQIENVARKRTVDYILSGSEVSITQIEDFCRDELLLSKSNHHPVGFLQ